MKLDFAWIIHYYKVKKEYDKKSHLDTEKIIEKKLNEIYILGGLIPLYSTIFSLDKVKKKIKELK